MIDYDYWYKKSKVEKIDDEKVAIVYKLLENKFITRTQNKKSWITLNLL